MYSTGICVARSYAYVGCLYNRGRFMIDWTSVIKLRASYVVLIVERPLQAHTFTCNRLPFKFSLAYSH
jgi:hypothetical protein